VRWLRRFLRDPSEEREAELREVRRSFESFAGLLDANKRALSVIADLEERSEGEHLFDVNSVRQSRTELRDTVADIVEQMIALGGTPYAALRDRHAAIEGEIDFILEGRRDVPEDDGTSGLGLPVPEGFAVSAATGGARDAGEHSELAEAQRLEHGLLENTDLFDLLERVLSKIAPLNLLHPGAPEFCPEGCRTLHDITRFARQKAMEEMLCAALEAGRQRGLGLRLQTTIPLEVRLIDLDAPAAGQDGRRRVTVDGLRSAPFKAFWTGVEEEGWPAHVRPVNLSGFVSVVTTQMGTGSREDFAEASFALLSARYMLLSLHLGYHSTTFESRCTPEPNENYVRMQLKGGGASADRRSRRVGLMLDLLSRLGFEHTSRGDFFDSIISNVDEASIADKLRLLGRITMLTKQLDMALANDEITRWYREDLARKLGLEQLILARQGAPQVDAER
jgi:hypothetical protein